jgi:hypothetical protein
VGIFDMFGKDDRGGAGGPRPPALEAAAQQSDEDGLAGMATGLVEKLLDAGIDGGGPFAPARVVAQRALATSASPESAVNSIVRRHLAVGAAGGFVTGLGGLVTMPIALPANVIEFYLTATRMVAAIAAVRGYDVDSPQIRTAVLLTLVGADADDLLRKAGVVGGFGAGGRLTSLAAQRLPGPALMMVDKAIGFRIIGQAGRATVGRLGKGVPVVGGVIGAGLDGYLLKRIADHAKAEFPQR